MAKIIYVLVFVLIGYAQQLSIRNFNFVLSENQYQSHFLVDYTFGSKLSDISLLDSVKHELAFYVNQKEIHKTNKLFPLREDMSESQIISDKFILALPENEYKYIFTASVKGHVIVEKSGNITLKKLNGNDVLTSDLLLADNIKAFDPSKDFFQYNFNGIYIKPTMRNTYVLGKNNALFWYFELYDFDVSNSTAKVKYTVYDENDFELYSKSMEKVVDKTVMGFNGVLNAMTKLKHGKLKFVLDVSYKNKIRVFSKEIYVYKKKRNDNISYKEYSKKEEARLVRYMLVGKERSVFDSMSIDEKYNYAVRFWKAKAEAEKKPVAELRKNIDSILEFSKNYAPTDKYYIFNDVTYVLMKYGTPSYIERVPEKGTTIMYDIFVYEGLANKTINGAQKDAGKFYFADLERNGRTVMFNSNIRGELNDFGWESKIDIRHSRGTAVEDAIYGKIKND